MTSTFISIITLILGIVLLILVALDRFQTYRRGLMVGGLLLLAVSIGTYLLNRNNVPIVSTPTETSAKSTPTAQQGDFTVSPISPISPLAAPEVIVTEVPLSEVGFEGCLLFTSNSGGGVNIYKLQQNSENLQQLTESSGLNIEPQQSPDGKQIVFASNREAEVGFQIYIMNVDGSDQQRLGPVQPGDNTHPHWSLDGRQIIFQSKHDTNGNPLDDNYDIYHYDIYQINSDGSDLRFLMTHSADDTEPNWSPDGSKIAFLSERSGQDEIYLMNPDGSEVTQLTELNVLKSGLNWANNSQHIVFEGSGELYDFDINTKDVTKFFSLRDSNETTPFWIQDKELLIFSSDRSGNWDLYIAALDNSAEVKIAQLTENPSDDRDPSWVPCQ
jgi:Tol biopolymer transport system component